MNNSAHARLAAPHAVAIALASLKRDLVAYRLAFGQPRQEELVEHLLGREFDQEELDAIMKTLIVDLCPISYKRTGHRSP